MGKITKELRLLWAQKLKESGFQDIEGPSGTLQTYDRRTISWDNRDGIRDFFLALDHWLESSDSTGTPKIDIRILKFYSAGVKLKTIAHEVDRSVSTVKNVIKKYKAQILGSV